jgi:biopolymer transport protein TolR
MAKKRRLMSEINVVPYIDVMLVLLIIFMITAPLLTQGISVDLPKATAQPIENQKDEPLVLSIDRDGRFFLNIGDNVEAPVEDSVVVERVSAVIRRNPDTPVLVKGDQSVPYGRVVVGAALLQQAGAAKIGFLTDPKGLEENDRGRRQRR